MKNDTYQISTVWVELTSPVASLQVQHRLIEEREDLEVRRGAQELHTLDGTGRDETGAATGLGAPGDLLALRISDSTGTV